MSFWNRNISVILVSFSFTAAAPAEANLCGRIYDWLEYRGWVHPKKEKPLPIPQKITHPTVLKWLKLDTPFQLRVKNDVGLQIRVNSKVYPVVQPLSSGEEAKLYVVKTEQGLRTAKVFHKAEELQRNLDFLSGVKKLYGFPPCNYPTPQVIEVDLENSVVIFEYIEGIPVSDLLRYRKILGINEELAQAIYEDAFKQGRFTSNIVHRFADGKNYLVDPY